MTPEPRYIRLKVASYPRKMIVGQGVLAGAGDVVVVVWITEVVKTVAESRVEMELLVITVVKV